LTADCKSKKKLKYENGVTLKFTEKVQQRIQSYVKILQRYADRAWYPPLLGLLAALDNFIVIIPNDGILISSSILAPKRWFSLALNVAIGSTLGAAVLAAFVETQGLTWILEMYPRINETRTWILTADFFEKYGMLLVFIVAVTPLVQQPAIILASMAGIPIILIAAVVFAGRFIKFLIMAYIGSHAPRLLSKIWGLKGELKDAGVKIP
jgi:membrane protein YqaA with SNARE-associated domain